MAPVSKTLALAGALFAALSTAAPLNKRDLVWETVTDIAWTTVDTTITVTPGQTNIPTPTAGRFAEVTAAVTSSSSSSAPAQTAAPESSSESPAAQAPASTAAPSTTAAPAPASTSSPVETPAPEPTTSSSTTSSSTTSSSTTSSAPAASSSSSSGSGSSGYSGQCSKSSPCSGDGTYYDTATLATNPSSCGTTNDGLSENVVALPVGMMADSYCGKTVTIEYDGKTSQGTVVDKCMGCQGDSIDLSRHFFGALADLAEGRLSDVKWYVN